MARGERAAVCGQCQQPFELLGLVSVNPRPLRPTNPIDASAQPLVPFALAVLGMVVLAIFAAIALIFINSATNRAERAKFAKRETHVAPVIPPPPFESRATVWYEPAAPFAVKLANGRAGVAGVFAREDARVGRLWLGAFDGETLAPAWSVGPLGETAESTQYLHAVRSGDAVVVTDGRGVARVIDAGSGAGRYALPLRARAAGLCAGPGNQVWVAFKAGLGTLIDVGASRAVPAARPAWCPAQDPDAPQECRDLAARVTLHARCAAASEAPGLYAFGGQWLLREGDLEIVVGHDRERGDRPAMAAFKRGQKAPLWRATLPGDPDELGHKFPLLTDLVDGVLYVKAESLRPPFHPHLMAFDARTGKLRWDTELPREEHVPPPSLTIADGRVLVATEGQLQVLDASSGALLGTVGD